MAALKLYEIQKMFNVGLTKKHEKRMIEYCKKQRMTMADLIRESTEWFMNTTEEKRL